MKFYSEQLSKLFDTQAELETAEEKANAAKRVEEEKKAKLKANRETRAKEVEDAFKTAAEAQKKANELLNAFLKDYGSYHTTLKDAPVSIWDAFFNLFQLEIIRGEEILLFLFNFFLATTIIIYYNSYIKERNVIL